MYMLLVNAKERVAAVLKNRIEQKERNSKRKKNTDKIQRILKSRRIRREKEKERKT